MRIYGDRRSGNCLKVKYLADHLRLSYRWIDVDVVGGETRTPSFLALNPQGQVPTVVFDDGRVLAQSNAILVHLAEGSALLPADAFARAKVLELLFWEQYSHEPYIAVCRYNMVYEGKPAAARDGWRVARGEQAIDQMDARLSRSAFVSGDTLTVADVALVAYTRFAHEGGFSLAGRPHVRAWIQRLNAALDLPPV